MPINTNFCGVDSTSVCGRSGVTGLDWGGELAGAEQLACTNPGTNLYHLVLNPGTN